MQKTTLLALCALALGCVLTRMEIKALKCQPNHTHIK
jgi:hypothetical protein